MDKNNDFTYDKTKFKDLPNFVKELHNVSNLIYLGFILPYFDLYSLDFFIFYWSNFILSDVLLLLIKCDEILLQAGMHYIPLIDAGVSAGETSGSYLPYDLGVKLGIFVSEENGEPFKGKTWNRDSTAWPDFTNPKSSMYYEKMMKNLHDDFEYDGAWIVRDKKYTFIFWCHFNLLLKFTTFRI